MNSRFALTNSLFAACLALMGPFCVATESQTDSGAKVNPRLEGELIYKRQCADCHGAAGEGVNGAYERSLVGDSSIGELTKLISETMPEGEPEACTAEDAQAVADYIHYAFYSPAAQVRNRPPKVVLTHLTSDQLRQSLSDLYAHFSEIAAVSETRGLHGLYFDGERWKEDKKKIERDDATINFDFGHDGPGDGINGKQFYIYWEGGLEIQETGRYQIIVESSCSFNLKLGHAERMLIDNHVQSGDKTVFNEPVELTGGRVYPIRLELRQRERKTEQPPAKIVLRWIPPGGVETVIPARNLRSGWAPNAYSLQTHLPPDDRSYGYDRGISINRQWDDAVTAAALEFAQITVSEIWPTYQRQHRKDKTDNRTKLRDFLVELIEVAFRGKLDDEQKSAYVDQFLMTTDDDSEAIKRVVLVALKSPWFLYPSLGELQNASATAANRLALVMYDSLPSDDWLLHRVGKGQLANEAQIRETATRMLTDYRARYKIRTMLHAWLNLQHLTDIRKDESQFNGFEPELVADLKASLNAALDDVVWSDGSDYRKFFTRDWVYTNNRIAAFYGDCYKRADELATTDLSPSVGDPEHRFGIMTHPFLMSGLAYHDSTSPIHRGVFLTRYVFGRTLRPPNEAFTPFSPDLHPDLTTRDRVSLQTGAEACQACHSRINGLGFILENYDAVGRFREQEKAKPINAAGTYVSADGETIELEGPHSLASYLIDSDDARRAFVNRAFQHFVKQPIEAFGVDASQRLMQKFVESQFNIQTLIVEIAVISATNPSILEGQGT